MRNKVVELLTKVLKVDINDDSSSETMPEWDSLAHMRIVVMIEDSFNIEVEDEMLPKLNSLGSIVKYLDNKIG